MQDEANQAGVVEERGLEGGRETTQNYIEMAGAAEVEGFSSGGAGQKDDSTAGSKMCDYEKVHPLTVDNY